MSNRRWDEEKRRANIRDHGIDFHDAWEIFKGPLVEYLDDREDYGEERWIAVGMTGSLFLQVVYTWRGPKIRIISARKANRNDQRRWFENIHSR